MWQKIIPLNVKPGQNKSSKVKKYFIVLFLLQVLLPFNAISQTDRFNLEVAKFGVIEQALLNQAIENDLEIQRLEKKLGYSNFVRDTANIAANTVMGSARVINLSSKDKSVRFISNGLLLGSDAINIITIGYKMYKEKKLKKELEERIGFIKSELLNLFSRLEVSKDDMATKNKLITFVGEKSTNDYLNWLESKSKGN